MALTIKQRTLNNQRASSSIESGRKPALRGRPLSGSTSRISYQAVNRPATYDASSTSDRANEYKAIGRTVTPG